ncbi:hypothetical protein BTVI_133571 [Pitangus sulphuratus]|nr:hypothetical protein BTVI_133571 [Pitangus sulphuratus]
MKEPNPEPLILPMAVLFLIPEPSEKMAVLGGQYNENILLSFTEKFLSHPSTPGVEVVEENLANEGEVTQKSETILSLLDSVEELYFPINEKKEKKMQVEALLAAEHGHVQKLQWRSCETVSQSVVLIKSKTVEFALTSDEEEVACRPLIKTDQDQQTATKTVPCTATEISKSGHKSSKIENRSILMQWDAKKLDPLHRWQKLKTTGVKGANVIYSIDKLTLASRVPSDDSGVPAASGTGKFKGCGP